MRFILKCRKHIHATQTKPMRDCAWNMMIHVERDGHQISPFALSFA